MYLLGRDWRDGHLDYHLHDESVRIAVRAWWQLQRLFSVFDDQPRSLRKVYHYLREVGLKALIRKVRSRLGERIRDRRVVAAGVGRVVQARGQTPFRQGDAVCFLAPCHPDCVERVVLPAELVAKIPPAVLDKLSSPEGVYLFQSVCPRSEADVSILAGWDRFSGRDIRAEGAALIQWAATELEGLDPSQAVLLPLIEQTAVRERTNQPPEHAQPPPDAMTAVLFGRGNYAKQCILPSLGRRIRIRCIHEVDPSQLGPVTDSPVVYDSCEALREQETYDVYLIAGYHHTHADLAVRAIQAGGWAVVEKPAVTTPAQLDALLAAVRQHPGRLFVGFHMRYHPFWDLARRDLRLQPGQPVHYHCIVFEIPVKPHHWYNWPNSGSRLVSNGCHWLDHFLFMNGYARPRREDLWRGSNGDLHISVELENGAVLGMVLTDMGSSRIGVQEHIELRCNGVTVTADNSKRYFAESDQRILRKARFNKARAHERMYRTIFRKIADGQAGDSLESVDTTCRLMLDLERMVQQLAVSG